MPFFLNLKFDFACLQYEVIYCVVSSFAWSILSVEAKLVWVHTKRFPALSGLILRQRPNSTFYVVPLKTDVHVSHTAQPGPNNVKPPSHWLPPVWPGWNREVLRCYNHRVVLGGPRRYVLPSSSSTSFLHAILSRRAASRWQRGQPLPGRKQLRW